MTNSSASLPMQEAEVGVVAIVDYGSGNLHSARKAFERAARSSGTGQTIVVTSDPQAIRAAERIVLPGVGAFADCRRGLAAIPGMVETLEEMVIARGRPFLGICVGMQLMASRGLEHETTEGLGWIPGDVTAIRPSDPRLKIPHMGWNNLKAGPHPVFARYSDRRRRLAWLFRAFLPASAGEPGSRSRRDRLWRADRGRGRTRQFDRHPVPSRKEPEARARADRQFSRGGGRDPVSRDRSQGRQVRPPDPWRHGAGHDLQRRSRRAGPRLRTSRASNIFTSSTSTALSPASR